MAVEERTRVFWEASLAWRGISHYEGKNTSDIIKSFRDLLKNPGHLGQQAANALDMVIHGKRRRKYVAASLRKNNKNVVPFATVAVKKAAVQTPEYIAYTNSLTMKG